MVRAALKRKGQLRFWFFAAAWRRRIVEDCAAADERRYGVFAGECGVEIGDWIPGVFDDAREAVKAFEAVEFLCVADASGVECAAEDVEGFVVGLQRNRKRMAVFTAVGERETRGIGEASGCAVNDFGDERERLQSARSKPFDEQERRKIAKFLAMGYGENGAEAFEIDIGFADIVMRRHDEAASLIERSFDILSGDGE